MSEFNCTSRKNNMDCRWYMKLMRHRPSSRGVTRHGFDKKAFCGQTTSGNPPIGDNLANYPKHIWSSQSIVLHIHTSPIFQSKIQLKSNISSIFDAINFQHFLEMLEIMLQNFQNHQLLISSILMHWILAFLEIL